MTQDTPNQFPTLPLIVHRQFIRDLSFETFLTLNLIEEEPNINLNVEVEANRVDESHFEVNLHVYAAAKAKDKTIFNLELTYSGVLEIGDIPAEYVGPVVLIEGPRLLFPFARSIVANITREAGFPPLSLAPIDFAELYRKQLEAAHDNAETDKEEDE